jgi:hypothetical protein
MGIFRLSANARTVRELLHACVGLYEKRASEEAMHRLFAPYTGEVDVAASVLKAYLREQSQPLIPTTFHDRFVSVAGSDQLDERIEQLAQHAYALPGELRYVRSLNSQTCTSCGFSPRDLSGDTHRAILERLTRSLHVIQANQEVNRMDASNLAIGTFHVHTARARKQPVCLHLSHCDRTLSLSLSACAVFAPSLLRAETEGLDIMKIRSQCQVIETFILHHNRIFTQDVRTPPLHSHATSIVSARSYRSMLTPLMMTDGRDNARAEHH